ncbi:BGTF surface domain-containing protein [Halobaculum sp. MBLA0147]|uniref:BGTF surface domain-containing protein n=1 Tax=Halobaculum sp. MBLA0147 TaxID=3079934 RepID=UPI0035245FB0
MSRDRLHLPSAVSLVVCLLLVVAPVGAAGPVDTGSGAATPDRSTPEASAVTSVPTVTAADGLVDESADTTVDEAAHDSIDAGALDTAGRATTRTTRASFSKARYTVKRGGIVAITAAGSESEVTIKIGDLERAGYEANVTVSSGTTLYFNTYRANQGDDAFSTENGQVPAADVTVRPASNPTSGRVFAEGRYRIEATAGPAAAEVPDATALLTVTSPSTNSSELDVFTAPGEAPLGSVEDVETTGSPTNLTASSDTVVLRLTNATWLQGLLRAPTGGEVTGRIAPLAQEPSPPIELGMVQRDPLPNRDPVRILDTGESADGVRAFFDTTDGELYVLINTTALSDPPTGFVYDTTLTVRGNVENPISTMLKDDVERSVGVELVEPATTIDTDTLITGPDQRVSGSTTLAPGTELQVGTKGTGTVLLFSKSQTVIVDDDRTFSATFDFRDQDAVDEELPREFEASVRPTNLSVPRVGSARAKRSVTLRARITPTPLPSLGPNETRSVDTLTDSPTPTSTPDLTQTRSSTPVTTTAPSPAPTMSPPSTATPTAVTPTVGREVTARTAVQTGSNTFAPGFSGPVSVLALLTVVLVLHRRTDD